MPVPDQSSGVVACTEPTQTTWLSPTAGDFFVGLHSENAAYRIGVRWQENGRWREGVYI